MPSDLERSHDLLRGSLIFLVRYLQRQNYSKEARDMAKRLRAVVREARLIRHPERRGLQPTLTIFNGVDLRELSDRIYCRRGKAVLSEPILLSEDAPPALPAQCHQNVDQYLKRYPDCHPVRGWLICNHWTFWRFVAHSLVETPCGRLVDITLHEPSNFLRHPGSDQEFAVIISVTSYIDRTMLPEEQIDLQKEFPDVLASLSSDPHDDEDLCDE